MTQELVRGNLALIEPSERFEADYRAMLDEYSLYGEIFDRRKEQYLANFPEYLRRLREESAGVGLPAGMAPQTTVWLVANDSTIVATARLRHHLNDELLHEGGHIGYNVRPSRRNHGFGTAVCALALEWHRRKGLTRVLITCDTDNAASARIIQKNGGKFENEVTSHWSGKPVSRYWVCLSDETNA